MEDCKTNIGEFRSNLIKQLSSGLKSMLSGRSTPQNSPCFRRLHSGSTPRREISKGSSGVGAAGAAAAQWFRGNRLLLWLFLITLWAYLGFFVQSKWAHVDKAEEFSGFGGSRATESGSQRILRRQDSVSSRRVMISDVENGIVGNDLGLGFGESTMHVSLAKKENGFQFQYPNASSRKRIRRRGKKKRRPKGEGIGMEPEIPRANSTFGFLVGPFGSIEDRILQWSHEEKGFGRCDGKGEFGSIVRLRRFVLIFHELSMTGAPLSMMELATELSSCGAGVSAVVLSRKGGLMEELTRRRIKVVEDKADLSFRAAMKADLVVAGSAVCASWIEQYIDHFPAGASRVVWWIMENRREYFDRSKAVLHRVNTLLFLSESQSKQWQKWCEEESLKLRSQPALIALSVNEELAFIAGIPSALSAPSSFGAAKMAEKRRILRDSVRREMGLTNNDMLVISLSSINPSKGQLLLLKSASSIVEEQEPLQDDKEKKSSSSDIGDYLSSLDRRNNIRKLLLMLKDGTVASNDISIESLNRRMEVLSHSNGTKEQSLKVLIGSVGSKSNKVEYVKAILHFLAQHSNLSKSVMWTPATTHVAALYSAADVYVINSQGLGETFGRVTIEAMAFGLPVLGTNAGGTQEIVEHNVTGLLHPIGRLGIRALARNLRFLLENRSARERMGRNGRRKVESMYLKHHMYNKFVEVLVKCLRSK